MLCRLFGQCGLEEQAAPRSGENGRKHLGEDKLHFFGTACGSKPATSLDGSVFTCKTFWEMYA